MLPTETLNGFGWGLRQALEQMKAKTIAKEGAIAAFVDATIDMFPSRQKNEVFKTRVKTYLTFNPDKLK